MNFKTYYDVLRVQRNATKETIEAAYKSLMVRAEENRIKGIHNPDDEEPETLFRAYDILSDDQKRRDYDRDIQANVNTYNQSETGIQQQVNYRNSNVSPIRTVNRPPRKSSILNKKISPLWITIALIAIILGYTLFLENGRIALTKWNQSGPVQTLTKLNENITKPAVKYTLPSEEAIPEEPMPDNGAVFMGAEWIGNPDQPQKGYAPFIVEAPAGDTGFYIKLKEATTNQDKIIFFLRSGNVVRYSLPLGTYKFLYASGTKWYGTEKLFGGMTGYFKAQKDITLYQANGTTVQGITIKLFKTPDGNMKE